MNRQREYLGRCLFRLWQQVDLCPKRPRLRHGCRPPVGERAGRCTRNAGKLLLAGGLSGYTKEVRRILVKRLLVNGTGIMHSGSYTSFEQLRGPVVAVMLLGNANGVLVEHVPVAIPNGRGLHGS